ncbi:hypothetical protein [Halomicronema sp. CCY15110]|uniref:hypothetical protein n=1 Tax=Halomicronema sp. CCY15110 TaxID=2767773 RepID=UPI00194DD4E8|nr:hypothetical protein [Halomicronema sp. CCY15110]
MKPTSNYTAHRSLTDVAHRLHLGRVFEAAHGAGIMTADNQPAPARAGWTTAQLLEMSEAKSLYN